jgi:hypothetical protein
MSTPTDPRREHPSTYVVQDRGNVEELTRLQLQDHLITTSMGGAYCLLVCGKSSCALASQKVAKCMLLETPSYHFTHWL